MKGKNQKLKLLYLAKIMQEQTDDTHALSMSEILAELAKHDILAQRKSIYEDLAALDDYGIEIIKERVGSKTLYHCGNRMFDIAELKFLVDAIQSSKFISEKKTRELITKLENNISVYDAKLLDREVKVAGRVKNIRTNLRYKALWMNGGDLVWDD